MLHLSSLRRTLSTPHSSRFASLAYGAFYFVVRIEGSYDSITGVSIPLEKKDQLSYYCVNNIIQVHGATIHGALNRNYEPVPMEIVEM